MQICPLLISFSAYIGKLSLQASTLCKWYANPLLPEVVALQDRLNINLIVVYLEKLTLLDANFTIFTIFLYNTPIRSCIGRIPPPTWYGLAGGLVEPERISVADLSTFDDPHVIYVRHSTHFNIYVHKLKMGHYIFFAYTSSYFLCFTE